MSLFTRDSKIGVVGAGAMGAGIAQVAATAGHHVILADANPGATVRARATIENSLGKFVEKRRFTNAQAREILGRVTFVDTALGGHVSAYRECALVIEAVVEHLDVKQELFERLDATVAPECVLGTNTSSLSVAAIASACQRAERVVGVHFFNPAPVMPLVEIVPWMGSGADALADTRALVNGWGKTTVVAADTPGFIVNRVARPFYGEALRILDEGIADAATIDWAMRELGGFRMGPFELMDFIGNDVNFAVTKTVFEAFFYDPRYRPSLTQKRLVDAGFLGRKSGRGHYDYSPDASAPSPTTDAELGRRIFERVLAMLINEAVDAVHMRVATPADIDLAMVKGVNYPRGLLAWSDELGAGWTLQHIERLQQEYGEDRYRPSPLLRRLARDGVKVLR